MVEGSVGSCSFPYVHNWRQEDFERFFFRFVDVRHRQVLKINGYLLAYKSRNFGQNLIKFFTIRLVCDSLQDYSCHKKLKLNISSHFSAQHKKAIYTPPPFNQKSGRLGGLFVTKVHKECNRGERGVRKGPNLFNVNSEWPITVIYTPV